MFPALAVKKRKMGKKLRLFFLVLLLGFSPEVFSQTDTEFWFVAPKVTEGHGWGGRDFFFRFATMNQPATITISMPANNDFDPITIDLPANAAHTEQVTDLHNIIWNFPPGQINNRGIHITSTNLITAYFEVGTFFNPDIFSLKGRNALGKDFFVPFQNYFRNGNYNPQPYSTIDIVATEDNTTVKVVPTRPVFGGHPPGDTITVVLNRAETYSVAPDQITAGGFPRPGQRPENRLTGSRVISDKPIAVTSSDDSVDANPHGSCKDLIGDQLIPVEILGYEYIAMRGRLNNQMRESFYVVAVDNATEVFVDGSLVTTLNRGDTYRYEFTAQNHFIQSSKPVYVYHVAGFGCEMGGAVLPPINVCTGSTQVAFTRSKGGGNERFFLNLLVRAGAEDGFILNGDDNLIQAADFEDVPGTTKWLAAEFEFNEAVIPVGVASLIQNTKDVFHIGIINGGPSSGTMYGYFSDFNELSAGSLIAGVGTNFEAICYGESAQLIATGGIDYVWSPADFLDDPFTDSPIAFPDTTMHYTVTVSGACEMVDSATITLVVTDPLYALFTVDNTIGCSPFDLTVFNQSIGVENYSWRFGDGHTSTFSSEEYEHTYVNNTNEPQVFDLQLVGRNSLYCVDTMITSITVFPEITAEAHADVISGCAPFTVNFDNLSSGAEGYLWKFGDGSSSNKETPHHTFQNYSDKDTTYYVVLEAYSEFGCLDYDTIPIHVKPYVKSGFEFDPPQHCNPYELEITNTSYGATQYMWDFDDGEPIHDFDEEEFTYYLENPGDEPEIFNISLITLNDYGCSDTLERQVEIFPYLKSEFEPSITEGCNPLEVSFDNFSHGAATYEWVFGDTAGTSSEENPVFEFVNNDPYKEKIFEVNLIARSEFGCRDTSTIQIKVYPRIEADFSFDYNDLCAPAEVTFNNHAIGATSYTWDFGDGNGSTSGEDNLTHTYQSPVGGPQTYTVTLLVENDFGCIEEKIREITIHPEVIAEFEAIEEGCHPLQVNFNNQSQVTGDATYIWDFGDGGSSTIENPTRVFINNSHTETVVYNVQLEAISQSGCRDSIVYPVTVFPKPKSLFSMPSDQGCAPLEVNFTDNSIGNSLNHWDFGDGNSEVIHPGDIQHTYENTGEEAADFYPELIVVNEHGCADTLSKHVMAYPMVNAEVSFTTESGCHPLEVEITNNTSGATASTPYYWSYGDGNTSTLTETTHTHTYKNFSHTLSKFYTTKLVAQNTYGCKDSVLVDVEVFPKPKSKFVSPEEPSCSPFMVNFTDQSIGGTVYSWDFGDGNSSNETGNTSHVFNQPPDAGLGWFTTILEVENESGCSDTTSRQVGVYPGIIADFTTQLEGCHPLSVTFENLSQGGSQFQWDFDDGSFSNNPAPDHVFLNPDHHDPKTFNVNLSVTNEFACQEDVTKLIRVFPKPKADFTLTPNQGCSPLQVDLYNLSVGGKEFSWYVDGETVLLGNPPLEYEFRNFTDSVKNYNTTLETINDWGCQNSFSQNVMVYPEVEASFTTANGDFEGCTPLELDFINLSERANQFLWDFGDNTQSTSTNPAHIFFAPNKEVKEFNVTLTAESPFGCTDVEMREVKVHPAPVADFVAAPQDQTYPNMTVTLNNQSLEGEWNYQWDMGDGNTYIFDEDPGTFDHSYVWPDNDYSTRHYTIHLGVDNNWCSDQVSRDVVIRAPDPIVDFIPSDQGCPPFEVQFENNSQYATSYFWDFDDGNYSYSENPVHVFENPGEYHVKLLVEGEGGLDSAYREIRVWEPPIADFRVVPTVVNLPHDHIQLRNLSSLAETYFWEFGDGNVSYEFEPRHYYEKVGEYDITLTVGTDTDPVCYDTIEKEGAVKAEESCIIKFPNAFMPNTTGPTGGSYNSGDPLNQVFYPVYEGIKDYRLEIYNRWGELVFRTEDLEVGWDGYYRGRLVQMDVYVWKVWATCHGGNEIIEAGDVTVYR